jgi:hypothetical protein
MDTLRQTLLEVLQGYTGEALNGYSYLTSDEGQSVYSVVSVGQVQGKRFADAGLIVRLVNGQIIIEHDVNDKPLVDALLQAGAPRQKIILAYAGEKVEEIA